MNKIRKNILCGLILSMPVCSSFAASNAYMDKINQTTQALNASLHSKYDLPAISQYLSGGGGAGASSTPTPSTPSIPNGNGSRSTPTTPDVYTPNNTAPSSSGGSWYVQPGDTGSSSGSSSGSNGGFDHSNLY